MMITKIYQQ